MGQTLLVDWEQRPITQQYIEKNPESALKTIIALQTNGQSFKDFLHCIVRVVMPRNDNTLKRLFYYYLETLYDDRSLFICINQISKDLESPNEYVRAVVLGFISRLGTFDLVSNFLKSIQGNLANKSPHVRVAALSCLATLAEKFEIDIEDELAAMAAQESSPPVLRVLFCAMSRLGIPIDQYLDVQHPQEVLDTLVKLTDSVPFLSGCLDLKYESTAFQAACRLLQLEHAAVRINDLFVPVTDRVAGAGDAAVPAETAERAVSRVLEILVAEPAYRRDFTPYVRCVQGRALDLLRLIDPYEMDFSVCVVEQVFASANTHEFMRVAEGLYAAYSGVESQSEKKRRYRVFLLDSMAAFVASHCVYVRDMVTRSLKNVGDEDVEIVHASLKFLVAVMKQDAQTQGGAADETRRMVATHLINGFAGVRQGRILRLMFDAIAIGADEELFERLLDALYKAVDGGAACFTGCEVFVGTHIALCIAEMYQDAWSSKARAVGLLIKLLQYGTKSGVADASAKSTISLCIRHILNRCGSFSCADGAAVLPEASAKQRGVLDPIDFPLLGAAVRHEPFEWNSSLGKASSVVQLSGLSDPLYIEANVSSSRNEILFDFLVINQTDSYLQNIFFDFITSKYVSLSSKLAPLSLQPNTASGFKAVFSVAESSTCFVSAAVSFNFPKNQEYASTHVQNICELTISIGQFLEGAAVDFKQHWKDLEWENIYSLTFSKTNPAVLLERIVAATNAHVCDRISSHDFLIANIACYTSRKALALANICFSLSDVTAAEVRVRSEDEEVVKNISTLISRCLKGIE
ncbi:coatomer subunit beta [Pancytospora philotis]|nr:coatomer subunit beta [Pancytospora philotis]